MISDFQGERQRVAHQISDALVFGWPALKNDVGMPSSQTPHHTAMVPPSRTDDIFPFHMPHVLELHCTYPPVCTQSCWLALHGGVHLEAEKVKGFL
jgi:hypothetical protein